MRTNAALITEPSLIGFLTRVGCDALSMDVVICGIGLGTFNDMQLEALGNEIERSEKSVDFRVAFFSGQAWGYEIITSMYNGSTSGVPPARAGRLRNTFMPFALVARQSAPPHYLQYMTEICEAMKRPPSESLPLTRRCEAKLSALPRYDLYTRSLARGSLSNLVVFRVRGLGKLRSTRVVLAAERYRIARGRWPASLGALVPEYLGSVPLDPFNDQPLRFIADGDNVRVYSVGEDLTDDGGVVRFHGKARRHRDAGFYLLPPERRGRPATSQPAECSPDP